MNPSGWTIRWRDGTTTAPWDGAVVGRSADADIVIPEDEISRRHCRFLVTEGALVIEDLGSLNGTFVNGVAATRARLQHGDEVSLASFEGSVEAPDVEGGTRPAASPRQQRSDADLTKALLDTWDQLLSAVDRYNKDRPVDWVAEELRLSGNDRRRLHDARRVRNQAGHSASGAPLRSELETAFALASEAVARLRLPKGDRPTGPLAAPPPSG